MYALATVVANLSIGIEEYFFLLWGKMIQSQKNGNPSLEVYVHFHTNTDGDISAKSESLEAVQSAPIHLK